MSNRLRAGAHRLDFYQRHIAEPLRSAEEAAEARASREAPIPASVKLVTFRYEYPQGQNVYDVFEHNLSQFETFVAPVGSPRDMTLAAMADASAVR